MVRRALQLLLVMGALAFAVDSWAAGCQYCSGGHCRSVKCGHGVDACTERYWGWGNVTCFEYGGSCTVECEGEDYWPDEENWGSATMTPHGAPFRPWAFRAAWASRRSCALGEQKTAPTPNS